MFTNDVYMANDVIFEFLSPGEHCPKLKMHPHFCIRILYLRRDCKAFILSYSIKFLSYQFSLFKLKNQLSVTFKSIYFASFKTLQMLCLAREEEGLFALC